MILTASTGGILASSRCLVDHQTSDLTLDAHFRRVCLSRPQSRLPEPRLDWQRSKPAFLPGIFTRENYNKESIHV
jgi:hypothetical protein